MNDNHNAVLEGIGLKFDEMDNQALKAVIAAAAGVLIQRTSALYLMGVFRNIEAALEIKRRPMMVDVVYPILAESGYTLDEIKSPCRHAKLAHVRQRCMWELSRRHLWSSVLIGQFLGGCDHSTILFGVRAHARREGLLQDQRIQA